jgi:hypothetical protein
LDVALGEVLPDVLIESLEFHFGQWIQWAERGRGAGLEWDTMVVGPAWWEDTGGFLAEDLCKVIVIVGDQWSWILTVWGRGLGLGSRGLWCRYQG